ncbi:hypothetical protein PAXRUDRAFT_17154 [Paxillus rubicundulus Ve08.2h10]|uniref:Unplaced genomic scaffold scaffold_1943, whole genome shotgun sequence n=1 Tax=Paxillus rubicundulus Ve08.2h10 TaxID=930991 RepID=A0A0D0CRK3_9AGAM|nr:hypothetical protein PAXRUDRAFT_17154 [Paxillus rubicundulus Ve08.2h10]
MSRKGKDVVLDAESDDDGYQEKSDKSDEGNLTHKLMKSKKSKAPPCDSGDDLPPPNMKKFMKGFSEFDVTQHVFKKEVAKYDKNKGCDALKCGTIRERTKNMREWFETVCKIDANIMGKVEAAMAEWKEQSPPEEWKKYLAKRIQQFQDELSLTMGVHCVIFHGHHSNSMDKGIEVGISETAPKLQTLEFKQHQFGHKICDRLGEAFMEYLQDEFNPVLNADDEDDKVSGHKGEKVEMEKDSLGALILPPYSSLKLPGQKDAIQQIMHEAYIKYTNNQHTHVPWKLLINALELISEDCLPDDLYEFPNPSKLIGSQVQQIWDLWLARQAKGEPIVMFTGCKKGDLKAEVEEKWGRHQKGKKKEYVEINEENDGDQCDGEQEGGDHPGASPGVDQGHIDTQSPAAHASDKQTRVAFLQTLSKAKTYQDLVPLSSTMITKPVLFNISAVP